MLWLIYESIIALEIRTSIVFNLSFPNAFSSFSLQLAYTFKSLKWLHKCLLLPQNS